MLIRNAFISIMTILFFLVTFSQVSAQSIESKLKLGMESDFFRIAVTTTTPEGTDTNRTEKQFAFGIMGSTFGIDVAYGLTQNVIIGVRSMFEKESSQLEEEDDTSTLSLNFIPHISYAFWDNLHVRPFVDAQLGVNTSSTNNSDDTLATSFLMGLSGGVSLFVSESLSIDPRLSFMYNIGSYNINDNKADIGAFCFDFLVGLSGWI